MARGFSPLDDRLGLLSCGYSPVLVETMVRLGTRLPFPVVAGSPLGASAPSFAAAFVLALLVLPREVPPIPAASELGGVG